jgi:signal transduction histidine kinase
MIWTWLHRRPLLLDVGLVILVWVPTVAAATVHAHPFGGVLLVTVQTLALLLRRKRPVLTVLIVMTASLVMIGLGIWLLPIQFAIALYTLAATRTPRAARSIGPASIVVTALVLALTGHYKEFGDSAARVVFLIAAWLLGDSIGSRQAYLREVEEKADRLERERDTEARRIVAEEQARIARELHDVIAHALSVIVVQAGAAAEVFQVEPRAAERPIRAIDTAARAALADLRRVLGILQDDPNAAYEPQPGLARLDSLVNQVRATGLEVALEIEGAIQPLPAPVDLSAYRIIQEALTNTIKHANADHARVSVRYGGDLRLEIRDDGDGATNDDAGHGLTGMRQRVAMLGGSIEANSPTTGGYLVTALIPLGDEAR